jgi:VWFA-related protein
MPNRLSRLLLPLFLVLSLCAHPRLFGQATPEGAEESGRSTYHTSVSEVRLVFFATDEHNHSPEGLQKSDFAVVDDEMVIRDFRSFSRADSIKLDLVVLIDSSESALPQFEQEIKDVQQLISQWPGSTADEVSVLSFSGMETQRVCTEDCRTSLTAAKIASSPKGGATPLFDAIEIATNLLIQHRQPDVLPVIILFSDGEDTISKSSFRGMLKRVLAVETQVYAIDISNPGRPSNGTATLQRIAQDSGGRYIRMGEGSTSILHDVIEDLRSTRVVTYVPPESGSGFHSIRILPTHNLKLQFRCRRGYYSQTVSESAEDRP